MRSSGRVLAAALAASVVASLSVGEASAAGTPAAQAPGCHGGPARLDISAKLGMPFSFTTGSTKVGHFQWRRADVNWAEVRTQEPNTSITLYRSDGAVCGPFKVSRSGREYWAKTGHLPNKGHGVWVCVSFPSGGQCGKAKKE